MGTFRHATHGTLLSELTTAEALIIGELPSAGDQFHGCDDEKYTLEFHSRSFKPGECPMMMQAVSRRSVGAMLHCMPGIQCVASITTIWSLAKLGSKCRLLPYCLLWKAMYLLDCFNARGGVPTDHSISMACKLRHKPEVGRSRGAERFI